MNFKELFEKLYEKYAQEFIVETYYNCLKEETIRIKNGFFEIIIPNYATSKKEIMIKTYNNLESYNMIESIANAINRLLKQK